MSSSLTIFSMKNTENINLSIIENDHKIDLLDNVPSELEISHLKTISLVNDNEELEGKCKYLDIGKLKDLYVEEDSPWIDVVDSICNYLKDYFVDARVLLNGEVVVDILNTSIPSHIDITTSLNFAEIALALEDFNLSTNKNIDFTRELPECFDLTPKSYSLDFYGFNFLFTVNIRPFYQKTSVFPCSKISNSPINDNLSNTLSFMDLYYDNESGRLFDYGNSIEDWKLGKMRLLDTFSELSRFNLDVLIQIIRSEISLELDLDLKSRDDIFEHDDCLRSTVLSPNFYSEINKLLTLYDPHLIFETLDSYHFFDSAIQIFDIYHVRRILAESRSLSEFRANDDKHLWFWALLAANCDNISDFRRFFNGMHVSMDLIAKSYQELFYFLKDYYNFDDLKRPVILNEAEISVLSDWFVRLGNDKNFAFDDALYLSFSFYRSVYKTSDLENDIDVFRFAESSNMLLSLDNIRDIYFNMYPDAHPDIHFFNNLRRKIINKCFQEYDFTLEFIKNQITDYHNTGNDRFHLPS